MSRDSFLEADVDEVLSGKPLPVSGEEAPELNPDQRLFCAVLVQAFRTHSGEAASR